MSAVQSESALSARAGLALAAALLGFAANSLLCRAALGALAIDAWSFTALRLASGALVLAGLARLGPRSAGSGAGSLASAIALYAYAAAFSLAYLRLDTGVGALVLFASVQATMIGWGLARGARPSGVERVGFSLAFAGLVVLARPGAELPDPLGLGLMTLAGVAWGVYSLRGRSASAPLAATAGNFARAAPLALLAWAAAALATPSFGASLHASPRGAALAVTSGALASGLGYSLWYLVLPRLSALRAALVQLLVPVLAGLAGWLVLGEAPRVRLVVATPLVLGGVALALFGRGRGQSRATSAPAAR